MNAADDGLAGIQQLAGDATLLYYMTEEAQEGKNAYLEKRRPDVRPVPRSAREHRRRRHRSGYPERLALGSGEFAALATHRRFGAGSCGCRARGRRR